RTVHSLVKAVSQYKDNRFTFISTPELSMPAELLEADNIISTTAASLESALPELDVLYMTRIQEERFANPEEYQAQRGAFMLNGAKLKLGKPDMIVMHPLPRVDEIDSEVDCDPRAVYFKQANYGMYVRMALILTLLGENI
ncbi:MAG: aspartate carbamoyltransferase, partial [Oscillospiraceae bacterium]|nr:aspartate carbamoyltransferase [Oscillospiraceae bacterium]